MKRLVIVAALLVVPAVAEAKVFDVYGQIVTGGGGGIGLGGAQKDADFFKGVAGGIYGAKLGAEVLFTDAWVEHWQYTDFSGVNGTWTQFMLGTDVDFALGESPDGGKTKPKTYAELGFAFGFGVGTGQQVEPPLDNSEVSDKGFIGQVSLGVDHRLNGVVSIGLVVPITYGYLFKNDAAANDTDNQYHSMNATPMVYLRLHLGK